MRWRWRWSRTSTSRCSASTRSCAIWISPAFKANYTPNFTATTNLVDQTQPPSSLLSGNTSQLTTGRSTFDFGVNQLTPWYGGSYQVLLNNGRTTTNNIFTSFDPQLTSNISASYTQPLLRNFKIDGMRQQLLVSQKNREIADTQLQQSIANTVRSVRNAYYDLMYAIGNLNVQRQSLELAQQSLKDNRARVEIGTMAPLDIVQAEAEVATREEAVILAEAAIERQQDAGARAGLQPEVAGLLDGAHRADRDGDVPADRGRRRWRGERTR